MGFKLWVFFFFFFFFALVNDLYIGDSLEANKRQEICMFQQDSAHEHNE